MVILYIYSTRWHMKSVFYECQHHHASDSLGGAWCCSGTQGKNSVGGAGAILVADGVPSGPCRPVLSQNGPGVAPERYQRAHYASGTATMA
jgi:hypothetical protein